MLRREYSARQSASAPQPYYTPTHARPEPPLRHGQAAAGGAGGDRRVAAWATPGAAPSYSMSRSSRSTTSAMRRPSGCPRPRCFLGAALDGFTAPTPSPSAATETAPPAPPPLRRRRPAKSHNLPPPKSPASPWGAAARPAGWGRRSGTHRHRR